MQEPKEICVQKEIVIHKNANEIFQIWRNFENLPKILHFLENVIVINSQISRWTTVLSGDQEEKLIWDVGIIEEHKNMLEWRSENNPDVFHKGTLVLIPSENCTTLLQLQLEFFFPLLYDSKPDMLGEDFPYLIEEDLRRFKLATEANEFFIIKHTGNDLPEGFPKPENPRKSFL